MEAFIILGIIGSVVGAMVASGKNRNAVGYATLGFFLPVIGIVAVMCLPPLPKPGAVANNQLGNL